ncbi:hypothetical protein FO519_001239 [Halicephalobus sp. NKZ332]|nr:hypothetical protein FO519_001239 [Halicephalobus sp. NKZ332]
MNNYFNYDDDDWINENLVHLSVDEIRNEFPGHEHCVFCFNLNCQDANCKVKKCDKCWARFHECKSEDHNEICPMTWLPCLNAAYGCPEKVRRDHLGSHLATCGASLVVCNLQWNREAVGKQAKRRMKQVARGFKKQMLPGELKEIEEGELDVFAALMDQREIMKSYRTARPTRVRQRTACTPANPVLPLRFYDESTVFNDVDSSDEEIFQDEQKRIKTKQPFADCYICKLEPGMQHLHVLGNLTGSNSKKEEKSAKRDLDEILGLVVPEFYKKRNLFVKLSEARMPDFHRKAFQYRWTREMHTFTCTETMRRDEIKNHMDYHNVVLQQVDGNIVKRCPAAPEGCDFFINQLIPRIGGRIRFEDKMQQFLFEPSFSRQKTTEEKNPEKKDSIFGDFREPHVLRLLLPYLDTVTIRTLCSLNSTLNDFIKALIKSRSMISLIWKRTGKGKWEVAGKFRSFSNLPDVMDLVPNVKANSTMITHISACQFYQKMDHGRDKNLIEKFVELGVRPASEIWKKEGHGLRHIGLDITDYNDFIFDD